MRKSLKFFIGFGLFSAFIGGYFFWDSKLSEKGVDPVLLKHAEIIVTEDGDFVAEAPTQPEPGKEVEPRIVARFSMEEAMAEVEKSVINDQDLRFSYNEATGLCLNQKLELGYNAGNQGPCVDLSHQVLENASLAGADLRGANLSYANLQNVNLDGANLEGANLQGAVIENSSMKNVNLTDASTPQLELVNTSVGAETEALLQAQDETVNVVGANDIPSYELIDDEPQAALKEVERKIQKNQKTTKAKMAEVAAKRKEQKIFSGQFLDLLKKISLLDNEQREIRKSSVEIVRNIREIQKNLAVSEGEKEASVKIEDLQKQFKKEHVRLNAVNAKRKELINEFRSLKIKMAEFRKQTAGLVAAVSRNKQEERSLKEKKSSLLPQEDLSEDREPASVDLEDSQ